MRVGGIVASPGRASVGLGLLLRPRPGLLVRWDPLNDLIIARDLDIVSDFGPLQRGCESFSLVFFPRPRLGLGEGRDRCWAGSVQEP